MSSLSSCITQAMLTVWSLVQPMFHWFCSHESMKHSKANAHKNTPTVNDVESLKQGLVKDEANAPCTILLVGETGAGKSTLLELFANFLNGKDIDHYDFDILDHTNEHGQFTSQTRTNLVRLYEFTSKNGRVVRILDTPGFADTQQDELHRKSIAAQIKQYIDSVTAVLVLANGTVPHGHSGLRYALSTLSAVFPKTLASNTAFVFTNVSSPLFLNISEDNLPDMLKGAPQFLLNNPVALQRKYLKRKDDPNMKKRRTFLRGVVKAEERNAIEIMGDLFFWLDGVGPHDGSCVSP